MNKKVRIFHKSNSVTQSAPIAEDKWCMEYVLATPRTPDQLMGWISSGDTLNQVHMEFDTLEEAKKFATEKGWEFSVVLPQKKKIKGFNYGDNFKYSPPPAD